ncbi:MAG: hypothetical protein ACYC2J_13460 [Acidithiobacillus ferrooxidans]
MEPLNAYRHWEQRLARAQRAMARKIRFSRNWQNARIRVPHDEAAHQC